MTRHLGTPWHLAAIAVVSLLLGVSLHLNARVGVYDTYGEFLADWPAGQGLVYMKPVQGTVLIGGRPAVGTPFNMVNLSPEESREFLALIPAEYTLTPQLGNFYVSSSHQLYIRAIGSDMIEFNLNMVVIRQARRSYMIYISNGLYKELAAKLDAIAAAQAK